MENTIDALNTYFPYWKYVLYGLLFIISASFLHILSQGVDKISEIIFENDFTKNNDIDLTQSIIDSSASSSGNLSPTNESSSSNDENESTNFLSSISSYIFSFLSLSKKNSVNNPFKVNLHINHVDYPVSYWSEQGQRDYQEDRFDARRKILGNTSQLSFYGVFDGHGGSKAAEFCQKNLLLALTEEDKILYDPISSFVKIFRDIETKFFQYYLPNYSINSLNLNSDNSTINNIDFNGEKLSDGSTAIVAMLSSTHLTVAHVGDSRAVLVTSKGKSITLTRDHTPNRRDEAERILHMGGKILRVGGNSFQKELKEIKEKQPEPIKVRGGPIARTIITAINKHKEQAFQAEQYQKLLILKQKQYVNLDNLDNNLLNLGGILRVGGVLAVSRSFGDVLLKPYVSCEPEVSIRPLKKNKNDMNYQDVFDSSLSSSSTTAVSSSTPVTTTNSTVSSPIPEQLNEEELDDDEEYSYLVLATDGLWDVITPQYLSHFLMKVNNHEDFLSISKKLCNRALELGSGDNITALVIDLRKNFSLIQPKN